MSTPLAKPAHAHLMQTDTASGPVASQPKILVVDDQEANARFLSRLLEYQGYAVQVARSGDEAIQMAKSARPDLIISDILMPSMDGYELAQTLRAMPKLKRVPIIFYTATYRLEEAQMLARASNVSAVLAKPSSAKEILDTVGEVLDGKARSDSTPAQATRPTKLTSEVPGSRAIDAVPASAGIHPDDPAQASRMHQATRGILHLSALRDPERVPGELLTQVADVIQAQHAFVAILDQNWSRVLHRAAHGVDLKLWTSQWITGDLGRQLRHDGLQLLGNGEDVLDLKLPGDHPPIRSFLGTVIATPSRPYGWIYLSNGEPNSAFTADDARLLDSLALGSAIAYENSELYSLVQRHAALMQVEVSERISASFRVERLNRMLQMLSSISTTIVRVREPQELFEEACRIAVQKGKFKLAWIGRAAAGGGVEIAASEGATAELVESLQIPADVLALPGESEGASAMQGRKPFISNDVAADPRLKPWQEIAARNGIQGLAVYPIMVEGQCVGWFNLHAGEAGIFNERERDLLAEMADDIAHGLEFMSRAGEVKYLMEYDPLTGLPNRTRFCRCVPPLLTAERAAGLETPLVVIDIARFSSLNDVFSTQVGDQVLKEVASTLLHIAGDTDRVARIAGDRFVLAAPGAGDAQAFQEFLEKKLQAALFRPMEIGGQNLQLNFRFGVSMHPGDAVDAQVLIRNAETAVMQAKQGAEPVVFYEAEMTRAGSEALKLEAQLRRALEQREFELYYQPKIDLRTQKVAGVEALIRWNHPEEGLIPPIRFIPLLEHSGLIIDVGLWVMRTAEARHRQWLAQGIDAPNIAVNISTVQMQQANFVDNVRSVVSRVRGAEPAISLEVTESMLISDITSNVDKIRSVRNMEIPVAIDDFGTGYSSLSYLARLPVTSLKIDRSFVMGIGESAEADSIITAIISLAHSMNLTVIAEGVETEEQLKFLRLLGCDEGQGYLFSRPLTEKQLLKFLESAVPAGEPMPQDRT